jgi:hypothetical protein
MHKPTSLTCISSSQPDAWPKAASASLAPTGWLPGYWPGPAYQPFLFGPSLVILSLPDVNCTATTGSHLSSLELFLHRAGVCRHICASKASGCFRVAAGLCFILLRLSPATSWRGRGGRLVQCRTILSADRDGKLGRPQWTSTRPMADSCKGCIILWLTPTWLQHSPGKCLMECWISQPCPRI